MGENGEAWGFWEGSCRGVRDEYNQSVPYSIIKELLKYFLKERENQIIGMCLRKNKDGKLDCELSFSLF